jgi:plasmid stability protein
MNITVRDLNEEVFRRFKGKAAERGMKMGAAVTQAMRLFIAQEAQRNTRKAGTIRLSDLTKGRDSTSEEIDSLLYGK